MDRLDIMAVTSSHLEKACDKLLRWCSVQFRDMGRDATLEVPDELSEAVRRLRSRPELLAYVAISSHNSMLIDSTRPILAAQRCPYRARANAPSRAPLVLHKRPDNW